MRNARWHHDDFTGLVEPLFAAGPDHDRRAADLEAFLLLGMDVRRRDETAGREIEHEFEQLTAGVTGPLAKHDPLAGHGMDDRVLCCSDVIRSRWHRCVRAQWSPPRSLSRPVSRRANRRPE
jgi:hypothetical protein